MAQQAPDGWFYYAVTLVLGGALIWVLIRYVSKIDVILTTVQEAVSELKIMAQLHEQKLETHDQEIEEIKKKQFTVNYKK